MKTLHSVLALLGLLLVSSRTAYAQSSAAERDIVAGYQKGQETGMLVTIFRVNNGSLLRVEPQHEFKQDDEIKVGLESNFAGYVYIVNYGSSGANRLLFPGRGERNLIKARSLEYLPKTYPIAFDKHQGGEVLRVFMSLNKIDFLDAAARTPEGILSEQAVETINQLWQSGLSQQAGVVTYEAKVNNGKRDARAAETREPIWSASKKSALITLRRRKGRRTKLAPNQIMVFGLNFQNAGAKP